jgi:hypothetical protein
MLDLFRLPMVFIILNHPGNPVLIATVNILVPTDLGQLTEQQLALPIKPAWKIVDWSGR